MAKKRFNNRPPMPPTPIPPVPPTPIPPDKPHFHFPHRHWKPNNHNADFAPMLLHPHIPHHFNFWCNKIIPLAYDDSLSYYEVLAKTTDYLNNMLNDEKMLAINVEELAQCFCELQHFVNDYFSFYQSKGLIVYDFAITSENYEKYLPDADTAQMNTLYRIKFVEGAEQNITANLPDAAKPYSGAECVLFNVSNFDLRRYGNQWQEVTPDEKEYSTKNNYQLFITDKDIFFRENNGDTWGAWNSIFANWWESTYAEVQNWVRELVNGITDDINARLTAEIARATAAENALGQRITDETNRATAAENALSVRLVAEYERAASAEDALDDKIEAETDRAQDEESDIRAALTAEITRATSAEAANSTAISAEVTRATQAENVLSNAITAETSRATSAENTLSTAITTENSRAVTAENALSARIANWETNLAQEVTDRQHGDAVNAAAISAETTRAQAAEQTNATAISTETTRAQTAEQAIRDNYIPNEGNSKNMAFTLERSTIEAVSNESGIYIDENTVDMTVGGQGNFAILWDPDEDDEYMRGHANNIGLGRFGHNNEITISGTGVLIRDDADAYIDIGMANVDNIVLYAENGAITNESKSFSVTATDGNILLDQYGGNQSGNNNIFLRVIQNGKAYYQKGDAHNPNANEEIATLADIASGTSGFVTTTTFNNTMANYTDTSGMNTAISNAVAGYVPLNGGSQINGSFNLNRRFATTGDKIELSLNDSSGAAFLQFDKANNAYTAKFGLMGQYAPQIIVNGQKCYYVTQSGGALSNDREIATVGDLSGYIPNGGNNVSGAFSLTRDNNIAITTTHGFDINIESDNDVNIESSTVANIISNETHITSYDYINITSEHSTIDLDSKTADVDIFGDVINIYYRPTTTTDEIRFSTGVDGCIMHGSQNSVFVDTGFNYNGDDVTIGVNNDFVIQGGMPVAELFVLGADTKRYEIYETPTTVRYHFNSIEDLQDALAKFDTNDYGDMEFIFEVNHTSIDCSEGLTISTAQGQNNPPRKRIIFNQCTFDFSEMTSDQSITLSALSCEYVFNNCNFMNGTIHTYTVNNTFGQYSKAIYNSCGFGDGEIIFGSLARFELNNCESSSDCNVSVASHNDNVLAVIQNCSFGILTLNTTSANSLRNLVVSNCFIATLNVMGSSGNVGDMLITGCRIVNKNLSTGVQFTNTYYYNNVEGAPQPV